MNIFINLSVIFWSLFPALMSYTQPASTPLKVELRQLVANSDLLIDSNNDGLADGFGTYKASLSWSNGVSTFERTELPSSGTPNFYFSNTSVFNVNDKYYRFAKLKAVSIPNKIGYISPNNFITGSGEWEFISSISSGNVDYLARIYDTRSSDWTPISVDYIGAINITDLVSRGCLPADLTDLEYKTLIDSILAEIGGTFQGSYFYTETIADNYKWFSTGFVEKTGERDFIDYLGFFVWLVVPYLAAFLVYKLLKGVIYG